MIYLDYFERVVAEVVDCRRLYEWALRLQMEGLMEDEGISPWSGRTWMLNTKVLYSAYPAIRL